MLSIFQEAIHVNSLTAWIGRLSVETVKDVFAIVYDGDGADTYIKFGGGEVDAGFAGSIALAIAAVAVILAIVILRSGKASAADY